MIGKLVTCEAMVGGLKYKMRKRSGMSLLLDRLSSCAQAMTNETHSESVPLRIL